MKERTLTNGTQMGNNIKTNLTKVEWQGVDWIDLAQHRSKLWAAVNKLMKILGPKQAMNFEQLRNYQLLKKDLVGWLVDWSICLSEVNRVKGKGHEVPEGEQRYSCTLSLTLILDQGG